MKNGDYTIGVTLTGGSGKAYIESPADVHIEDGCISAEIVWSSPNYDYMEVDSVGYYPINSDGNSVFMIDVPKLDCDIPMLAETVAMSEPHMIEYTLRFDSSTLKSADFTSLTVICAVLGAVIISAAAAAFTIKRKKKINETIR